MNKMMIKQGIIFMDMQYAHGWIWFGGVEKLRKSVLFYFYFGLNFTPIVMQHCCIYACICSCDTDTYTKHKVF